MTRFFVRHPVSTWMIFTAFVVMGIYALPRLKIEAIPEIDLPSVSVMTQWTGASPQAVQRSITLPVEEAVRKVQGIESVKSTSMAGRSNVEVEFRRGTDIEFAQLEMNEQLGGLRRELPAGAQQPQILPYVPEEFNTEDFFAFSLESELGPNELREHAEDWIAPQLLAIEGVADAQVQGGARPLVKILLDRAKLELYGITADQVFTAVDALDDLSGAGTVRQDGLEKLVALRDPVDLSRLERAVVARRGGVNYTLRMLARVEASFEDPTYFVRANGKNVVKVVVEKRSGANSVAVSRAVRHALPEIEASLPFAATFHIDEDEGKDLEDKLRELALRSLVILGLMFVLLAVSLRQVRLTAIVTASILFAIVISLSLFYFLRISVNFITISGLTVCFGLILDNSILVLDSIHRRLVSLRRAEDAGLTRHAKRRVAAETIVAGTSDVVFPILATTLTTVVAFLSFIFLSGRLALYYVPLAVSVSTAMAASLFVAFAWIPVVLNQGWTRGVVAHSAEGTREVADEGELAQLVEDRAELERAPGGMERMLGWTQRLWWLILPVTTAALIWGVHIYQKKVPKGGFWRLPNQEELLLYLEMPAGTDVQVTSETMQKFEELLLPIPEGARMSSTTFDYRAVTRISFDAKLIHSEVPLHFRSLLVQAADATAGTSIYIAGFSDTPYFKGAFGGSALNSLVKLTGYNSRTLREIAQGGLERIERVRRVRKARITSGERFASANLEETVIHLRRDEIAQAGLTVLGVVGEIRRLLGVDFPWSMLIDGEEERVQLSFSDAERIEYTDLAGKWITSPGGEKVMLGNLVSIETVPLSGSITRENQRYTMYLNWEYIGTDRMRSSYLKDVVASFDLPYGYSAEESRQEFFTEEEEEELTLMAVLAAVFIFMILAALFESILLPVLVLMAIPPALFGVVVMFWLTDSNFDSSARIGLILLFGIVVNNAILLVSRYRTEAGLILKERCGGDPAGERAFVPGMRPVLGGSDLYRLPPGERVALLRRAVARGTCVRLRSILLTSGTTIVALAPLLIHFRERAEEGKDIWENLALSSIGGLASSTIFILLALPPLYYFCVRFGWVLRRFGGWLARVVLRRGGGAGRPAVESA